MLPAKAGYERAEFVNGAIYTSPNGGVWTVLGEIYKTWQRSGLDAGELGLPTSDEYRAGTVRLPPVRSRSGCRGRRTRRAPGQRRRRPQHRGEAEELGDPLQPGRQVAATTWNGIASSAMISSSMRSARARKCSLTGRCPSALSGSSLGRCTKASNVAFTCRLNALPSSATTSSK
ncbi:hypothetical protein [Rhodococcus aetherivorans]|uniref:LGFP repeat-containing protein n=1 Tax=Rhodococcus aetherivorans TaxID=191292 RepID=UPI002E147AB1